MNILVINCGSSSLKYQLIDDTSVEIFKRTKEPLQNFHSAAAPFSNSHKQAQQDREKDSRNIVHDL